jgi:dimethylamine monooxygenase subunit A
MPFDFSAVSAPFRMQPGLRRLAPGATQLTPLRDGDRALREKLAVLSAFASQALLRMPGFDATPALEALCRHGAAEHPAALGWDGSRAVALQLGWAVQHDELLPLRDALPEIGRCLAALPAGWRLGGLLALAFAEDFAIVDADSGCIPWLAVCLPSHWAPEAKVGRHFREIHAPVADNAVLLAAGAHLMRLVTAPDRWERFVWTITPHSRLDSHPERMAGVSWPVAASAAELAALACWRTERQTFIPLPACRQAVFTIHVDAQPLVQAISSPAQAAQLHDAVASMSRAVLAYRGLEPARDRLLVWLDAQASP